MIKAIIVFGMTLASLTGFSLDKSPIDTIKKDVTTTAPTTVRDTTKGTSSTNTTKADNKTDSSKQAAAKKENLDSTSLFSDLTYQRQHPEILYAHKVNSKVLPWLGSLLLVVVFGLFLMFKTGLCRDLSYNPATNQLRELKERPYSHSRMQIFWWTLIILTCFSFFYFYTGFLLALNPTIILLLGGGLATSIFGTMVDNSQMEENVNSVPIRHQDLEPSKGLFADILSDEGGISIHRFQSLIFNIIFGLGFVSSFVKLVNAGKEYPFIEFENWQLTLLGMSAAGYLGFKSFENSKGTKTSRQVEAVTKNTAPAKDAVVKKDEAEVKVNTRSAAVEPPTNESVAFKNLKESLVNKGLMDTTK